MNKQTKHTVEIFERIYKKLPPLVPECIEKEMKHSLEHLKDDYEIGVEEVENIMIAFGKKIWPYWKAFGEFFNIYQGRIGEKFLLSKMDSGLKKEYKNFKQHGGDYHTLRLGEPAIFFDHENRLKLSQSFVEVDLEIRDYARQRVLSTDRKKYEELIVDFQNILDDIKKRLDSLLILAEDEEEHPELAEELRQRVRFFEFGMCSLGPNIEPKDVFEAENYFLDRKETKRNF